MKPVGLSDGLYITMDDYIQLCFALLAFHIAAHDINNRQARSQTFCLFVCVCQIGQIVGLL